jgi:hypothetical protein
VFSPVNVRIKPSKIRRWLSLFIHSLGVVSLCYVALPFYLLILIAIVIGLSALQDFLSSKVVYSLLWDLSQGCVRVASDKEALVSGEVQRLHLLFGLLFIHIKLDNDKALKLFIFKDSVDKQSYRKLRVAARWAKLHNSSQDV